MLNGELKQDLISLIEALGYYRDHTENADIEEFDRKMAGLDYEEAEIGIRQRIANLLEWK